MKTSLKLVYVVMEIPKREIQGRHRKSSMSDAHSTGVPLFPPQLTYNRITDDG
jgi:hypothetical protein